MPRTTESPADAKSRADGRAHQSKPCQECGQHLGPGHGNRRYHPDCAALARQRNAAANSARYRQRQAAARSDAQPAEVPEGYDSETVTVPGIALTGARVLELRAALHGFLRRLHASDQYLRKRTVKEVVGDRNLLALRGAVDEGLHLIAILDQYLPAIRARSPWDDPDLVREAIEAGVSPYDYVRPDKPRPAAPPRRAPVAAKVIKVRANPHPGP